MAAGHEVEQEDDDDDNEDEDDDKDEGGDEEGGGAATVDRPARWIRTEPWTGAFPDGVSVVDTPSPPRTAEKTSLRVCGAMPFFDFFFVARAVLPWPSPVFWS